MTGKEVRKALEKDGWVWVRRSGCICLFEKEGVLTKVVVPMHGQHPLSIGVLKNIEKITGLSLREKK